MDFPPEILGIIFRQLSQRRLPQCAIVCQRWLQAARHQLYDSITLHSCDQTRRLIETLKNNSSKPPLGHLIRNMFGVSHLLSVDEVKAIEFYCSYLERIDVDNAHYVPLWYQLKQLSLNSVSFRDLRVGQWLTCRGHQLEELTTNLDTYWGSFSPYASFTMVVLACPAGHFANLVSLTLAKGDTCSYGAHHADPELQLDLHILHVIHRSCPVLSSISFVYPRLPVNFKNLAISLTDPPITTITTTTSTTVIEAFDKIKTLGLKISSRTSSIFFDLFAIMYPNIERLDLQIEEVNKGDDIRRRLRTPELFDSYRTRLFNMATSFRNLKEMRLHTTLTHDILEVYWAHRGWIDWIDAHSMIRRGIWIDPVDMETQRYYEGNRFERLDMTSDHHHSKQQQVQQGLQRRVDERDSFYVGNGSSLIQLSHLSISLDMTLPKLMTDSLFRGRKTWPYLTTLQIVTNKHKVIVMDILLSAAPHLVSLKLQAVTFKASLRGKRQSVEQRKEREQQQEQQEQQQQEGKKRRIDQYCQPSRQENSDPIFENCNKLYYKKVKSPKGERDQQHDHNYGNYDNDRNHDILPLHGLEKLYLFGCEIPASDMITQWMARCPKLKELIGEGLDIYNHRAGSQDCQQDSAGVSMDANDNQLCGGGDDDDDDGNGYDIYSPTTADQQDVFQPSSLVMNNELTLVSADDYQPYDMEQHMKSTPLVHINAPYHQLDFVSLQDIHHHNLPMLDIRKHDQYGLFLSLVVEQLWQSPPPPGSSPALPNVDMHLDYYSNTPHKALLNQNCSGDMIQSPKGYIKLTCQSLDSLVW